MPRAWRGIVSVGRAGLLWRTSTPPCKLLQGFSPICACLPLTCPHRFIPLKECSMAQTLARIPGLVTERQQLRLEKVGVIAGFLLGLALAVGWVGSSLADLGVPAWLEFAAAALTVAVTTRLGLSMAASLSRKLAA